MPTVLESGPYRFYFYANDYNEPPHIHIQRERNKAKYWLNPVRLQQSGGFSRNERYRFQNPIEENEQNLLKAWHEFFTD
jgi:hypothetical protein